MIRTHYLPMYKPHPINPQIVGYKVWAWVAHPLLGQIKGTDVIVKTKREAQRVARKMRETFNQAEGRE